MSTNGLLKKAEKLLIKEGYKDRILWLKYLKGFNLQLIYSLVDDFEKWVKDKMSNDYIVYT